MERARELIHGYNDAELPFFESYFEGLPSVDETFYTHGSGKRGRFGIVYADQAAPFAYKLYFAEPFAKRRLTAAESRMNYLRAFFKEIIIQTLLQSDSEYGKHICKLHSVYRTGPLCLSKMEKLDTTLHSILEDEAPDRATQILALLVKFFEILIHFHTAYGFRHNDLHTENIMTMPRLKLLDFGNSSVTVDGVELNDSSDSDSGIDDLNALFASAPLHVPPSIVELFAELAAFPEDEPYESYFYKLIRAVQYETAWIPAFHALGRDLVDNVAQFKADFNVALEHAKEEGVPLPTFIDEYVINYRRVLRMHVTTRPLRSTSKSGSKKRRTYRHHK